MMKRDWWLIEFEDFEVIEIREIFRFIRRIFYFYFFYTNYRVGKNLEERKTVIIVREFNIKFYKRI